MYLRHHDSHLLTGPSARYPEVRFSPLDPSKDQNQMAERAVVTAQG